MSNDALENMVSALMAQGPFSYGSEDKLLDTAIEWLDAGFGPEEASIWLDAHCFHPDVARKFEAAGLEPDDVDYNVPKGNDKETLAFRVCSGDIMITAAIRMAQRGK